MAISDDVRGDFEELQRAFKNDDVALLECRYKATGEIVHVICAVNPPEDDGQIQFLPFAILAPEGILDAIEPPMPMGEQYHPKELAS